MVSLTVTEKGQVILDKEVLDHLGVRPGENIEVNLLPKRRLSIEAPKKGAIEDFFGSLKNEHNLHFTLDEMDEEIEKGWAGEK